MTNVITTSISSFPVLRVCVYTDRAEVTRSITLSPSQLLTGQHELKLNNMVATVDPDSIRVRADASAEILEVTSMQMDIAEDDNGATTLSLAAELITKTRGKLAKLERDLERIQQQDKFVLDYMNKKMAADASPSASEVTELLTFFQSTSTKNDDEQREAAKSVVAQRKEVAEAERAFRKLSEESRTKGREASILFNASDATKELKMAITYNVARASWRPTYDIRVTASRDGKKSMQLTYFGSVRQNSGEDWTGAQLSLSTATPSVGGCPEAPPSKTVYFGRPERNYGGYQQKSMKKAGRKSGQMGGLQQQQQMMVAGAANDARTMSFDADELDTSSDEEDDDMGEGMLADAKVAKGSGGSSTFVIERLASIESDDKEHKCCIAIIDLAPQFKYFITPSVETKAYLQVKTTNSSSFPLLPSKSVSVFFDGSYVCKTELKEIFPSESFSVFLGVDNSVKCSHKVLKKKKKEGAEGGFMKMTTASREEFQFVTKLHNTKDVEVEVTLVEVLPKSTNEQINVQLLEPKEEELEGYEGAAGGAGKQVCMVTKNKVTNNVVFSKVIKPGEKIEVKFGYQMEWPAGFDVKVS